METMETQESVEGVVEKLSYLFKRIINLNCRDALDVEGFSVCPYHYNPRCPYATEESFSPKGVIEHSFGAIVPSEVYAVCSRKPKT